MGQIVSINNTRWTINENGVCLSENGHAYNILTEESNVNYKVLPKKHIFLDTIKELKTVFKQLQNQVVIGNKRGHIVGHGSGSLSEHGNYSGDFVNVKFDDGSKQRFSPHEIFESEEVYKNWLKSK